MLAWQNRAPALALALLVASAGDVLLAYDAFVPGLAAFLVAQLFYAVLFARRFQWRGDRLPLVLMLLLWSGSLLLLIGPQLGALAVPVYAYVVAILTMGLAALLSRQRLWPGAAGAACFILSDSLIALGLFQTPLPAHGWAVMATYYLAQWLITNALIDQAQDA